jgi:four helix bundle protein
MHLVRQIFGMTSSFPPDERFGLTSQMRRAAISIPSNIAEGAARETRRESAHFVSNGRGSLSELETQALIATDQGYIDQSNEVFTALERISQLVSGLHRSLKD